MKQLRLRKFVRLVWGENKLTFKDKEPMVGLTERSSKPDERLSKLSLATEAMRSQFFWSWLDMFAVMTETVSKMEAWWEACPCHENEGSDEEGEDNIEGQQRGISKKDLFRERLGVDFTCPLCTRRAPELAAGGFDAFTTRILSVSAQTVASDAEVRLLSGARA